MPVGVRFVFCAMRLNAKAVMADATIHVAMTMAMTIQIIGRTPRR